MSEEGSFGGLHFTGLRELSGTAGSLHPGHSDYARQGPPRHALSRILSILLLVATNGVELPRASAQFSLKSSQDTSVDLEQLERRGAQLQASLQSVCAGALEARGALSANSAFRAKLEEVVREAQAVEGSAQKHKQILDKTLKNLDVSGGGDLVEGRKMRADALAEKISRCEKIGAACRVVSPKIEELNKIFQEAELFRSALSEVFGIPKAEEETHRALEKKLTELFGPLTRTQPAAPPAPQASKPKSAEPQTAQPEEQGLHRIATGVSALLGVLLLALIFKAKVQTKTRIKNKTENQNQTEIESELKIDQEPDAKTTRIKLFDQFGNQIFETEENSRVFGRFTLPSHFRDSECFAPQQFTLLKTTEGWKFMSAAASYQNHVNGVHIPPESTIVLKSGDIIALGKQQTAPLRVEVE
jgi:hypothetical protein